MIKLELTHDERDTIMHRLWSNRKQGTIRSSKQLFKQLKFLSINYNTKLYNILLSIREFNLIYDRIVNYENDAENKKFAEKLKEIKKQIEIGNLFTKLEGLGITNIDLPNRTIKMLGNLNEVDIKIEVKSDI